MGVDQVKGGSGAADSPKGSGKKDKVKGDEFKEFMKVDEIGETDTEQKRKRKERSEEVEEIEEEESLSSTTPKEQVAPFSMEPPEKKRAGPAELQNLPLPSPLELSGTPSPESDQEIAIPPDFKMNEIETHSVQETRTAPSTQEKAQEIKKERETSTSPSAKQPPQEDRLIEQKREAEKKGSYPIEPPPVLEEKTAYFQQNALRTSEESQLEKEEIEGAIPQNLPPTTNMGTKIAPTQEKEVEISPLTAAPQPAPSPIAPATPVSSTPAPYTQLPSAVWELFNRMVGVITILSMTPGISETTIHLTSEQFASSLFYGTEVVIKEDRNAKNQFNIEINAPAQAATLLNQQLPALVASFENGGYRFTVKQIRVNIVDKSESPFKRKAKMGEETEEEPKE